MDMGHVSPYPEAWVLSLSWGNARSSAVFAGDRLAGHHETQLCCEFPVTEEMVCTISG